MTGLGHRGLTWDGIGRILYGLSKNRNPTVMSMDWELVKRKHIPGMSDDQEA